MKNSEIKLNMYVHGKVRFAGIDNNDSDKQVMTINLDEKEEKRILSLLEGIDCEHNPVKYSDFGDCYFKAGSKYGCKIYEGGEESQDIDSLESIGKDSVVSVYVTVKPVTYRKKTSLVAYIKGVNILEYVEPEEFNPFDVAEDEEYK